MFGYNPLSQGRNNLLRSQIKKPAKVAQPETQKKKRSTKHGPKTSRNYLSSYGPLCYVVLLRLKLKIQQKPESRENDHMVTIHTCAICARAASLCRVTSAN